MRLGAREPPVRLTEVDLPIYFGEGAGIERNILVARAPSLHQCQRWALLR